MKIVFFGTSEFAIPSLRALIQSKHKVIALVTQPDRKKGRRLLVAPPPTKVLGTANAIPAYQTNDASSQQSIDYLKKLGADLFVVISFGQILKKEVLSIPKLYSINIHGSLLPRYRGAAPTNWAIINGDRSSGVTVIRMTDKMDAGDILLKHEVPISDTDTNITLSEKLSDLGAKALLEAIAFIEQDKADFAKQDERIVTYAPKLKKEDGLISWCEDALKIHNKVRGLIPWPGAHTNCDGKSLKILHTEIKPSLSDKEAKSGEVVDIIENKGIVVRTGSGDIVITHLQLEGKKALDADSFLRGHKIEIGYVFT